MPSQSTSIKSNTSLKPANSQYFHHGAAWGLNDFPDNNQQEIVERLSRSNVSLRDLVELAREADPEAFARAVHNVEEQQAGVNRWSTNALQELAEEFGSDLKSGLTSKQVAINRETYGFNVIERVKQDPVWKIFFEQFMSPVVLLLLGAAVLSFAFQEWVEGSAILIIVFLNATLATYMEKSAGDALAKLASMAAPKCKVIRDGEHTVIEAVDVVPGDIVKLETGDAVPADIRLVELAELKTNEAILTGKAD